METEKNHGLRKICLVWFGFCYLCVFVEWPASLNMMPRWSWIELKDMRTLANQQKSRFTIVWRIRDVNRFLKTIHHIVLGLNTSLFLTENKRRYGQRTVFNINHTLHSLTKKTKITQTLSPSELDKHGHHILHGTITSICNKSMLIPGEGYVTFNATSKSISSE